MTVLKHDGREARYKIPLKVALKFMEDYGLGIEELVLMVGKSALISHSRGNRRFHDFLFRIIGKNVQSVSKLSEDTSSLSVGKDINVQGLNNNNKNQDPLYFNCEVCRDTHKIQVYDECIYCGGVGCSKCNKGEVMMYIPCTHCRPKEVYNK